MSESKTAENICSDFESEVAEGKKLGRTIGFPTANQYFPPNFDLPPKGIYVSRVKIDGKSYPAVSNVGTRPTVDGEGINCESHIIGYSGQLYGKRISTTLIRFLRAEKKFESVDALKEQIGRDVESALEFFACNPDTLL